MKLQRLGRTGLLASQVGLGTVELGLDYGMKIHDEHQKPDEKQAAWLLNQALDRGISFLDTARVYGTSEELIGKAVAHRRDEFILSTKVAPFTAQEVLGTDLRAHIRASVETSLRALRTDRIDILMLHSASADLLLHIDVIAETLREWQQSGSVRYLGASIYEDAAAQALDCSVFDCLQIAYNALDRRAEQEVFPAAGAQDIGIVARSALLKGVLTDRYRSLPPEMHALQTAAASLDRLAQASGLSLPELAFRYVLGSDSVILCGTARTHELQSAIDYCDRGPLDADLVAAIRNIEVADRALLNPGNWQSAEVL